MTSYGCVFYDVKNQKGLKYESYA